MPSPEGQIAHVSDTALMVAACRALETEAPDGLVNDPFARRLAGDHGMAILQALPHPEVMQFLIGVRSHFLDELLLEGLEFHPIDTVLALGCGLDTRPWRLDLPPGLRWIEVDFPDILDYKDALMSTERPRCRRERLSADLTNSAQRHAIYAAIGAAPALMITEGLLMYLPAATVDALAAETHQETQISHWIVDISTRTARAVTTDTTQSVQAVRAPDALEGEQILDTIQEHGWVASTGRSYLHDIEFALPRVVQLFGNRPRPADMPTLPPDDPSGVHWFSRAEA